MSEREKEPLGLPPEHAAVIEDAVVQHLRRHLTSRDAHTAHLTGSGPIAELEKKLCRHYGKKHAVLLSSATSALWSATRAIGVRGVDVVTSPLSWAGTIAGAVHEGAQIVFADVDPTTLTLSPEAAASVITDRTKAILGVDLFGVPADDKALRGLADQHGIWYVHDSAQSFGATSSGRPAGALAHVIVVSFGGGKPLDAGEGGAVLTDDDALYEHIVWETQHPYRHKRELALSSTNEMALHQRIHPLAAAWALADFEAALDRLTDRQGAVNRLLDIMERAGLIAPLGYRQRGLTPTFVRVTARVSTIPEFARIRDTLQVHGLSWTCEAMRLELLSSKPEVARHLRRPRPCPVACEQARCRVEFIQ